jgi:hypothetical protein
MRRRLCHATITTPFRRPSRWLFDAPDDRDSDRLEDVIVEDLAVVDVVVADDVADDRPECADEVAVLPGAEPLFLSHSINESHSTRDFDSPDSKRHALPPLVRRDRCQRVEHRRPLAAPLRSVDAVHDVERLVGNAVSTDPLTGISVGVTSQVDGGMSSTISWDVASTARATTTRWISPIWHRARTFARSWIGHGRRSRAGRLAIWPYRVLDGRTVARVAGGPAVEVTRACSSCGSSSRRCLAASRSVARSCRSASRCAR